MASSSLDELLEMVRNWTLEVRNPSSYETVGVDLGGEDALRALILNLDASEMLSNEVTISTLNEYGGPATISIPKVSFVKTQIEQRKPHFVGISEVKNRGDRGAEGENQLLLLLSSRKFGYLSVKFPDEYLIHGWDRNKYEIAHSDSNEIKAEVIQGQEHTIGSWGYGHRYIWTRLVSRDDTPKTFILVTCHMPIKPLGTPSITVPKAWEGLMKFIKTQNEKGVPILLMGDTNRPWAVPYDFRPSTALRLQDVIGLNPKADPPKPYPHLALDQGNDATTVGGGFIDNFIFFYKDGEKHIYEDPEEYDDHFQKNYRVHYHKLGWTSHHVLLFEFNERLLTYALSEPNQVPG